MPGEKHTNHIKPNVNKNRQRTELNQGYKYTGGNKRTQIDTGGDIQQLRKLTMNLVKLN